MKSFVTQVVIPPVVGIIAGLTFTYVALMSAAWLMNWATNHGMP